MTVRAGKYEVHFAPMTPYNPIKIEFGVRKAKVTQCDELITIIDNNAVSDMVKAMKEIENVEIEMR